MAEYNNQKKKEDLENVKELIAEFKKRNAKVRRQEKLELAEKKNLRKGELLGKYMAKMLYKQNNGKFKTKYLRKLEKNWQKQKEKDKTIWENELTSSSGSRNLEGRVISELQTLNTGFFI